MIASRRRECKSTSTNQILQGSLNVQIVAGRYHIHTILNAKHHTITISAVVMVLWVRNTVQIIL